jgi:hypothetical protein
MELTYTHKVIFDRNTLPKEIRENKFSLHNWLCIDGEWVKKGKPLCCLKIGDSFKHKEADIFSSIQTATIISAYDGIVQICKTDGSISENEVLCAIHPSGVYENENSKHMKSFRFIINGYNYEGFDVDRNKITIKMCYKRDGEKVEVGDKILDMEFNSGKPNKEHFLQLAEKEGYFEISEAIRPGLNLYSPVQGECIYSINEDDNVRIKNRYINTPLIEQDDFTNTKTIRWEQVGGCKLNSIVSQSQDDISLSFTFNYINNQDYIVFRFVQKQLDPVLNDDISFFFDDNAILNFSIIEKPYKVLNVERKPELETKILITDEELLKFETVYLKNWKISLKKTNREIIGAYYGFDKYVLKNNLNIVIKKFAKEYREVVREEIDEYKPVILKSTSNNKSNTIETCFVYLMHDTTNDYFKIGISNIPEYREYTLQSEKPTIILICAKEFPNRKIAESIEKALHHVYKDKRLRGEWFKLEMQDILDIKATLK